MLCGCSQRCRVLCWRLLSACGPSFCIFLPPGFFHLGYISVTHSVCQFPTAVWWTGAIREVWVSSNAVDCINQPVFVVSHSQHLQRTSVTATLVSFHVVCVMLIVCTTDEECRCVCVMRRASGPSLDHQSTTKHGVK